MPVSTEQAAADPASTGAAGAISGFTCYGIAQTVGGLPITDFDDLVDIEEWAGANPSEFVATAEAGVDAKLFLVTSFQREPKWAAFMRSGFGDDLPIQRTAPTGALLLVRVDWKGSHRYFAFTFGAGRFLLRDDCYLRRFGLRVALNALFEGDTQTRRIDSTRIRSVSAKRVSGNTVRSQHQSSRAADLEAFDVDRDRDFLRGVTGVPADTKAWGTNLTGADSLTSGRVLRFADLPALCVRLLKADAARTYRHRFGWIDDIAPVDDKTLRQRLEDEVISRLRAKTLDDLDLSVPELVDWNQLKSFVLPYQRRGKHTMTHPDLRLEDYIRVVEQRGRLEALDGVRLRSHRIEVDDDAGTRVYRWPAWRCLTAEIGLDGRTFVLDEGDFYEVATGFLATLDRDIQRLVPDSSLSLPPANVRSIEEVYNADAAEGSYLLLDRRTVRIDASTSPIEICDLLSPNKQFVHVKRKLGSSVLSHLFAQGYVSADLLQQSSEYRARTAGAIHAALKIRDGASPALNPKDFAFVERAIQPSEIEVVYAIIADWSNQKLVDRLPFFSKVNLRRHATDLRNRGFLVTHCRVQTTR